MSGHRPNTETRADLRKAREALSMTTAGLAELRRMIERGDVAAFMRESARIERVLKQYAEKL